MAQNLTPPLDEYRRQLQSIEDDARTIAGGLDSAAFNWSPKPGAWSVAQAIDHLTKVDVAYGRAIEKAIAQGRERGITGGSGVRLGFFERWFIRSMEPPPKRRFSAPGKVKTEGKTLDPEQTLEAFLEINRRLDALLEEADGLDLSRVKVTSPLARFLKFRLGAAFALLAAHDRRHLWQARRVTEAEGFPG